MSTTSAAATAIAQLRSKRLGKTGLMVSELCFGCMTIGSKTANNWGLPTADEAESIRMLDEYVARGGNFFDTANVYGDSEEVLGRWLQGKRREDFVIATKVRGEMGVKPNDSGLSRKHIIAALNQSLKRLQTDYIDLYQLHSFDVDTPLEETLSTLNDLVRAGKIRYIGVSNFSGWQLQKALDLSEKLGLEKFVSLQPQYNLLCRSTEWDLTRICEAEGLGCLPWSPLAGGWLSGKVNRSMDKPQEGSRVAWAQAIGWRPTNWTEHANEHTWGILDTADKIAKAHGKTVAQVSLRWLMQKPTVTAPIFGAKTVEQLKINLEAANFTLTAEEMEALDKASYKEPPYPWNQYWNDRRSRF